MMFRMESSNKKIKLWEKRLAEAVIFSIMDEAWLLGHTITEK